MKKRKQKKPLALLAEKALQEAVNEAIRDHAKTNDKVVIFKNGKVVEVSARTIRLPKKKRSKKG